MKFRKWMITAVMLGGMTAALLPAVPASAASVPTDGTGTVVENTTADSSSREFFTIKTADGNVFYIVVDKTKTDDNVYLLTPVTEDSLKALAESAAQKNGEATASGTSDIFGGQSDTSGTTGAPTTSAPSNWGTASTGSAAKTKTAESAASVGNIAFLALVAVVVFAAAFYFKIYKPKHKAVPEALDEEQDDYDSDEEDDGDGEEDEPAPAQKKPKKADQARPEQVQPEEEPEPDTKEPRAPDAPRPRREDVWPENGDGISEQEPEPQRPAQATDSRSSHARIGGLFAPDASDREDSPEESEPDSMEEPEEPEPEDDENMQDYEDGMDAFGNPDQED